MNSLAFKYFHHISLAFKYFLYIFLAFKYFHYIVLAFEYFSYIVLVFQYFHTMAFGDMFPGLKKAPIGGNCMHACLEPCVVGFEGFVT